MASLFSGSVRQWFCTQARYVLGGLSAERGRNARSKTWTWGMGEQERGLREEGERGPVAWRRLGTLLPGDSLWPGIW